jgi:hypothetical protein
MQTVVSTVPGGLETPDFLQLRKDAGPAESEVSATPVPRELYQVIPERQTNSRGFMGSSTAYDVGSLGGGPSGGPRVLGQDDRGTKVSVMLSNYNLATSLTGCFDSAKRASKWPWIRTTWKTCLKKNCGRVTTLPNRNLSGYTYRVQTLIDESSTRLLPRPKSRVQTTEVVGTETDARRRSSSFKRSISLSCIQITISQIRTSASQMHTRFIQSVNPFLESSH